MTKICFNKTKLDLENLMIKICLSKIKLILIN